MRDMRARGAGGKTAKGYWRVSIVIYDEFGRKRNKGFEAKTLTEAKHKALLYQAKHGRTVASKSKVGTIKELFDLVVEVVWSKSGDRDRRDMLAYSEKWTKAIGDVQVDTVTSPMLTQVAAELAPAPRSLSYVSKLLRAIRTAMAYAVSDLGWIETNPALSMRAPSHEDTSREYAPVNLAEYQRMLELAAAENPRMVLLTRLIGECGMRPIEAVKVRATDLQTVLDEWVIVVAKGKTKSARRVIPVTDDIVRLIHDRKDSEWDGISDPCDTWRKWWRANSKTRLYDMRGWFSDNLRQRGVDDQIRARIMGHANPKITKEVYETVGAQEVVAAVRGNRPVKRENGK